MELADKGLLQFLGINVKVNDGKIDTSVYRKNTNKGLLLHYQSSVDVKYKKALVRTMLYRAYRISSSWTHLHEECRKLRDIFQNLCYPESLLNALIKSTLQNLYQPESTMTRRPTDEMKIPIVLPFKTGKDSSNLRSELKILSEKTKITIAPVFTSRKLSDHLRKCEPKHPLISKSLVVYEYKCACDMRYVGYTSRHLHERVLEHQQRATSSIFKHRAETNHQILSDSFSVIAKCQTTLDCRVRESIEIHFRKPSLNARDEFSYSVLYK